MSPNASARRSLAGASLRAETGQKVSRKSRHGTHEWVMQLSLPVAFLRLVVEHSMPGTMNAVRQAVWPVSDIYRQTEAPAPPCARQPAENRQLSKLRVERLSCLK